MSSKLEIAAMVAIILALIAFMAYLVTRVSDYEQVCTRQSKIVRLIDAVTTRPGQQKYIYELEDGTYYELDRLSDSGTVVCLENKLIEKEK